MDHASDPAAFASGVVDVLPRLINVAVLPLPHRRVRLKSGPRQAGILRDASRESRKFLPGRNKSTPVAFMH